MICTAKELAQMFLSCISVLFLVSVVQGEQEIKITQTCVNVSSSGVCLKWKTSGNIKSATKCFPGDSHVIGRDGSIKMSDLKIGDEVMVYDKQHGLIFSKVTAWLHRAPKTIANLTVFETDNGKISMSASHDVGYYDDNSFKYKYKMAHDFKSGERIISSRNGLHQINHVSHRITTGLYAPYTPTGTIYVGDDASTFYLAHCFAHLDNPEYYFPFFDVMIRTYQFFSQPSYVESSDEYYHPVASVMMNTVGRQILDMESNSVDIYIRGRRARYGSSSSSSSTRGNSGSNNNKSYDQMIRMVMMQVSNPTTL